jgi:glycosyltransferase involved in cell wall biosynthesis
VEGFGLLAAEAMACGACVVASDCDGLRSIVKHKQTGLVFRNGNAEELADMVILALREDQLRNRLGQQASIDAHQRFTFKRQAEHMQACLDSVCAN